MSMADLLMILGVFALSVALRTTGSTVLQKVGVLGYLSTSFLAGWLLTGWWPMGLVFVSFWLVWPWYELITRVRKIAMPVDTELRHKTPPHREMFPALGDLTEEIEGEGFEHVEDLGREWDEAQQFFRVFHKPDERDAGRHLPRGAGKFRLLLPEDHLAREPPVRSGRHGIIPSR